MRKPPGYWRNWENVKKELFPICEELDRFPSQTELNNRGLTTLARAISTVHGGVESAAQKMGYATYDHSNGRKMMGFWNINTIAAEYMNFIKENHLDYYPGKTEFTDLGKATLYRNIVNLGGYSKFKETLKENFNFILKEKSIEIKWSDKNIETELKKIHEKIGYLPSSSELDEMNLQGLRGAIHRNGGIKKFAQSLNLETKLELLGQKDNGYWKSFENIKKELDPIILKLGHFPSYTELRIMGRKDILIGFKHFNGINNISKLFGYNYQSKFHFKTRDGHLVRSVFEVIVDNFFYMNDISHETEGFIVEEDKEIRYMYDFKVKNKDGIWIYFEIWGYRKSKSRSKLEKMYNEKRELKESLYREQNLKLISLEEKMFNKNFEHLYRQLKDICISNNIKKTGFYDGDDLLDLLLYNAYSAEDLLDDLKPYIDYNESYMPTNNYLLKNNRGDLAERIKKFGGYVSFRDKFGLKKKPLKKRKWENDDYFYSELIPLCEMLGRFPTQKEFYELKRGDLMGAITKRGGIKKVAKDIGILTKLEKEKLEKQSIINNEKQLNLF